ncbi:thioredoxin family protein [Polymorphospora sp. NPDC051019]|uniref:TlpA family protein disulfide reductase n=1 Tax=Polymorphospora sp. NPDC051019 TaxID=3155725 RepID=UPI0034365B9F
MDPRTQTGLLVVVVVLAVSTAYGLWHRHRAGRLRPVRSAPAAAGSAAPAPAGAVPSVAGTVPTGATVPAPPTGPAVPVVDSGQDGPGESPVAEDGSTTDGAAPAAPTPRLDPALLDALGVAAGTPATLLQFSSAFCAPCRTTRRVLGEVAGMLDGVRHVEVDAESHLDAVRALGIWRTPTVLVVDARGEIVQRAAGVPAKAQVIAALAPLLPGGPDG